MSKIMVLGGFGLIVVLIVVIFGVITEPKVNVDNLAECLTEKGVIMAGTDWCPACKAQKNEFGDAFDKINYKNCDYVEDWCLDNNISGFPTWVFPNGTQYRGVQNPAFLSQIAGCEDGNRSS